MEDDEFFDTDIEEEYGQEGEDITGKGDETQSLEDIYLDACKRTGVVPSSKFLRQCFTQNIDLKHYGLGDSGTRAVCSVLKYCNSVTNLNLHDNGISDRGMSEIAKMLKKTVFITNIDLSGNQLGKQSADEFGDMFLQNDALTELNLSNCGLQGKNIDVFCNGLSLNTTLTHLNLSYNDIGDRGAGLLANAMRLNAVLSVLDVSWNSIRVKGARFLAEALKANKRLRELNLAWNGLLDEGVKAIEGALSRNNTLLSLDICSNRITSKGVVYIAKILKTNNTLEVLKTGRNPFQCFGACVLLRAIQKNPASKLRDLQLDDIVFDKDCALELGHVFEARPCFTCSWGTSIVGERKSNRTKSPDIRDTFMVFVRTRGLRLIDLFKILTKDRDALKLSKEDFVGGMKKLNAPMNDMKLRELFDRMDSFGNGVIVFQEFASLSVMKRRNAAV